MLHRPAYSVEAWLEAEFLPNGCKLDMGSRVADKRMTPAFLVAPVAITDRLLEFTRELPKGSNCESVECYKFELHFVAALGVNVSVSATGGVSGTWIMAQHDLFITLTVCSDGSSSSKVRCQRTSGPASDKLRLTAIANGNTNSDVYKFGDETAVSTRNSP